MLWIKSSSHIAGTLKDLQEELGISIKTARVAKGLTRAELAEKSGVRLSEIKRIEGGEKLAGITQIYQISRALDRRILDIFVDVPKKEN